MSKKNSSVILKNGFKDYTDISKILLNFKKKLNKFKKDSFVVAVSGGPDSLALVALTKACDYENNTKFKYVLINHNIRKNSSSEALAVKKMLKQHEIKLEVLENKIDINKNIQSFARSIRYDLLINYCKKKNIKSILTAHNLEDQVETFFIRLSRGSGLTGLSAMQKVTNLDKNIKLYRPLLDIKKKILIKISKKVFGKYFKDPSNTDTKYLRARIRKLEEPLKKSGINYDQIIKSINNLASSKATLDQYFYNVYKNSVKKSKNKFSIDLKEFRKCNQEIKIRLINESIKHISKKYYNPRSKKVINLITNLKKSSYSKFTLGGCIITKGSDKLLVKKEKS